MKNNITVYDNKLYLPFPSKIKNFSNSKLFIPKIFLTYDSKFFEKETFYIGHNYFKFKKLKKLTPTYFHYFPKNNNGLLFYGNNFYCPNNIILIIDCEFINNQYIIFGTLTLTNKYLLFETKNDFNDYNNSINYIFSNGENELTKKEKQIIIKYQNIEEIIKRRFLFMYQAIEIFLLDGKSYFFNLFQIKKTEMFFASIEEIKQEKNLNFKLIKNPIKEFEKMKIIKLWYSRQIDTSQFLLYINKYSSRTFNDINQYPIFPWIIKNQFILKDNEFIPDYRIFNFPISIQEDEQRFNSEKSFNNSKYDDDGFQIHFRLHYSNGAYVILYLTRLSPFTEAQIKLQNNKFDSPDRQFSSFDELINILLYNNDNRELIPDLYYSFEYFYNLNYNYFGIRNKDKEIINNIIIPYSFNKPAEYVYYMRYLLNGDEVKYKIDNWIDNVFGIYQYSDKPDKDRFNSFNPIYYGQYCKFMDIINNDKLDEKEKKNKILSNKTSILLFGQTPDVLFKNNSKYIYEEINKEKTMDELSMISNLKKEYKIIKNKKYNIIINFWITYLKDKEFFYFLCQNDENYYIQIIEFINDFKFLFLIDIDKIKLFRKTTFNKNKNQEIKIFKLNPKYIMFDIIIKNNFYLFVGRNDDNSLMIYSSSQQLNFPKKIQTHSLITTLYKINETNFISGHFDGKIIEWEILDNNINLKIKRDLFAHNNMICSINYIEKHNILVTSSNDGILYVRKYFDFELLTIIKLGENEYANDIIFSNYDMYYLLIYNKNNMTFNFNIYSINGLHVTENKSKYFIDQLSTINNGKIIYTCYFDENIYYYCLFGDKFKQYNIKTKNLNFKNNNHKINKFFYNEEKNIFYFLLSDNIIYRMQDDNLKEKLNLIQRKKI